MANAAIQQIEGDLLDQSTLTPIEEALLAPLRASSRLDVAQKLQNTQRFLALAKAHTIKHFPPMQSEYYEAQAQAQDDYDGQREDEEQR